MRAKDVTIQDLWSDFGERRTHTYQYITVKSAYLYIHGLLPMVKVGGTLELGGGGEDTQG